MPGVGSRSAKWAWDHPGGGCHRPLLGSRSLCLHMGFVRATIGSLLQPSVAEIKEWSVAAAARMILCPFFWARTGTQTGYFRFKNPWYVITYQDARYGCLACVIWDVLHVMYLLTRITYDVSLLRTIDTHRNTERAHVQQRVCAYNTSFHSWDIHMWHVLSHVICLLFISPARTHTHLHSLSCARSLCISVCVCICVYAYHPLFFSFSESVSLSLLFLLPIFLSPFFSS